MAVPELNWQPSLLDIGRIPEIDETFASLSRVQLDPESWVDHAPGWVRSSDSVPKVAKAGPRMSIAFRHGLDPTIYDNADATPSEN